MPPLSDRLVFKTLWLFHSVICQQGLILPQTSRTNSKKNSGLCVCWKEQGVQTTVFFILFFCCVLFEQVYCNVKMFARFSNQVLT